MSERRGWVHVLEDAKTEGRLPLSSARPLPSATIEGTIARSANALAIGYTLLGRLREIAIPEPAAVPERKNGLWKDRYFELFLTVKGSRRYWEFNLSPARPCQHRSMRQPLSAPSPSPPPFPPS